MHPVNASAWFFCKCASEEGCLFLAVKCMTQFTRRTKPACKGSCSPSCTIHADLRHVCRKWQQHTAFSYKQVVHIGVQLASGLNCLHDRGFLHGDLKPNNVGLGSSSFNQDLTVKLLDLGRVIPFQPNFQWDDGAPYVLSCLSGMHVLQMSYFYLAALHKSGWQAESC